MDYMTISEASEKWGISRRRIQVLCTEGRNADKPSDARIKTGKYIKGDTDL